jgi:hypothetical protein
MMVDAIQPSNWSEKGELPRGKSNQLADDKILCPTGSRVQQRESLLEGQLINGKCSSFPISM